MKLPWLVALLPLLPACGVHSLLNQIEDEYEATVDLACDCTNVFPDRAACEAMFVSPFSFVSRDCLEDALKEDKNASEETLKCSLDVIERYNGCLKDKLDCQDPNSFSTCNDIFMTECPELPEAVQTAVSACSQE